MSEEVTSGQKLAEYLASHIHMNSEATEFLIRLADSRTLLTAPHTKASFRDGQYKPRDRNVGIIAMEAGRASNSSVLIPTTPGDNDGNWAPESKFRALLEHLIADRVLIDVHGMADKHNFDIVIGTAGHTSPIWLVEMAAQLLTDAGFIVDVRGEGPLSATGRTITALANTRFRGGIQIEIARKLRNPQTNPDVFSSIIEVVTQIASNINQVK